MLLLLTIIFFSFYSVGVIIFHCSIPIAEQINTIYRICNIRHLLSDMHKSTVVLQIAAQRGALHNGCFETENAGKVPCLFYRRGCAANFLALLNLLKGRV